ncbi:MAG: ISAs1 family transposase [Dermatophilaceae bacterium]
MRSLGLDAAALDAVLGAWMWTRTHQVDQRRVIAIDGKTVRGARASTAAALHLVAAMDHGGAVLGQLAVTAKSNEIPAVRALLATFDLAGVVVTVDAMHTQTDTAQLITGAGGDYVFTVKRNQPTLYAACQAVPWSQVPARRATSKGHGRRATRTIKVITAPAWVEFTGAAQIAQIRRTTTRKERKTVEVVYLEPPRHVRRLRSLGRLESCQRRSRGGTRRSCGSGRCGWLLRSVVIMGRSGRR